MNDTNHEQLSALLDGELPRDELRFLLRRLDGDADLARRWSRFQIVSAVLRREYAALRLKPDFAAAVLRRLDAEATPARRQPFGVRALRWAAGGAIAASVAVVALLATRPDADGGNPAAAAPLVAATAPAPAAAAPVGELHQPLLPQVLPLADFAQPASFESIIPNYAPTPRLAPAGASGDGFVPYVLIVGTRQPAPVPQQPAPRQDGPAQQ